MVTLSQKASIYRSLIRFVPATFSVISTFAIINLIGKNQYGLISLLLTTSSGINSVLFHWARNLIVFQSHFNLSEDEIYQSWISSLLLTPIPLFALIITGKFNLIDCLLIFIYLLFQSSFEREIEYLRKNFDLRNYVLISCARPILNIFFIFFISQFFSDNKIYYLCFLALGLTPLISRLILKQFTCHTDLIPKFNKWNFKFLKLIPKGILITVPTSYIFLQDIIIKYVVSTKLNPSEFGEFAFYSDVSLSLAWVIISASCWDFIPLAQKNLIKINGILLRKINIILLFGGLAVAGILLIRSDLMVNHIKILSKLQSYNPLILTNHLIAALISSLLFSGLILKGFRKLTLILCLINLSGLFLATNYYSTKNNFITVLSITHLFTFLLVTFFVLFGASLKRRQEIK